MATSLSALPPRAEIQPSLHLPPSSHPRRSAALLATFLTPVFFCLAGYHPFAEDGGLYLTGIRSLLDPTLYRASLPFVTAHLRYSLFAPTLAAAVRGSGLPLEVVVLLAYLLCLWLTILAASLLADSLFPDPTDTAGRPSRRAERLGAVLLLTAGQVFPVAGTSLSVADPSLTARSLSTPCVLLALAAALHLRTLIARGARLPATLPAAAACALALILGTLFHPLMTGYGAVCLVTLVVLELRVPLALRLASLALAALLLPSLIAHNATPETPATRAAALTRGYWFLSGWHWYELLGLAAPLLLLATFARHAPSANARALARATLVAGLLALGVTLLYAHPDARSLAVARLQPLRLFHVAYLVMLLLLGAALGSLCRCSPGRWTAACTTLAAIVPIAGCLAFSNSRWLELPRLAAHTATDPNPWVAAFLWSRDHTPANAVFALDADYIAKPSEDAQSFRLLAERSSLADQAKDGGEAAITPRLAEVWQRDVLAQQNLSALDDATRRSRLEPLGVTWVVLQASAPTQTPCPYRNDVVKVCPLR